MFWLNTYNANIVYSVLHAGAIKQTFSDWELIIFDDGSWDHSLEVCQRFAESDSRIRVYSRENNLGLAASMNEMVKMANGEYLAVQEQDDISLPQRLEREIEVLESKPKVGLVSGIAAWLDDQGRVFNHFPGILVRGKQYPQERSEMVKFLYIEQCKIVNACCMFRRSIFDKIPHFDEDAKMSIDWQFFIHLAHYYGVWGIHEVLVHMRRGSSHGSLTKDKALQFAEARRCIKKLYYEYKKMDYSPIDFQLYRNSMATQITLEARVRGGFSGFLHNFRALGYWPFSKYAWWSIFDYLGRAVKKLMFI